MKTNNTMKEFRSHASIIEDVEAGVKAWIFSIEPDSILLCAEGEVSILLTKDEQLTKRSEDEWKMFLVSRGQLSPVADNLAVMLATLQKEQNNTISEGEPEVQTIAIEG